MEQPQLATIDNRLIERVRDRIVAACAPRALYLFGSAARGEVRAGSDLDLLVVTDLPEGISAREKSRELHALFEGWLLPLDIIVQTPETFAQSQKLLGHIARTAARDGMLLYSGGDRLVEEQHG